MADCFSRRASGKQICCILTFNELISTFWKAVGEHIDALRHSIEKTGKSSVSKHTRTLLESFFTFLDLRRLADCGDKSNDVSASLVESSSTGMLELKIIDSMVALILKINDTAFRPFFVRLIEWATSSLSKGNVRGQTLRLITLFRFSTALSERLRVCSDGNKQLMEEATTNRQFSGSLRPTLTTSSNQLPLCSPPGHTKLRTLNPGQSLAQNPLMCLRVIQQRS